MPQVLQCDCALGVSHIDTVYKLSQAATMNEILHTITWITL